MIKADLQILELQVGLIFQLLMLILGRVGMVYCGTVHSEGRVCIVDDDAKDGNLSMLISLQLVYIEAFEKLFYESVETNL